MSLPSNPTASFVKRNPHLYGRPTVAENATVAPDAVEPGEEGKLQKAIYDDCVRRGWKFSRLRMDKRSTDTPGRPDFIIAASGGRTLWVECKTRTGKLDPDQRLFQIGMENQSHVLYVVRSMTEWLRLAEGKE